MSESLKKKRNPASGLFSFFSKKMEHPNVKCNLLFLTVLVTFKTKQKLLSCAKVMRQMSNIT